MDLRLVGSYLNFKKLFKMIFLKFCLKNNLKKKDKNILKKNVWEYKIFLTFVKKKFLLKNVSWIRPLIFLILYNANLQDRAVLVMWSEKFSWSSITTPRFLAVFEGVMVDVHYWKVKLWWNNGFAETASSSVLARLSSSKKCLLDKLRRKQLSSDHQEGMRGRVECHQHSSDMKSHVSEWQKLVKPCRQKRELVQALSPETLQ